jgi:hypothetical protein
MKIILLTIYYISRQAQKAHLSSYRILCNFEPQKKIEQKLILL